MVAKGKTQAKIIRSPTRKKEHPLSEKIRDQTKEGLLDFIPPQIFHEWCCDCGLRHTLFVDAWYDKKSKKVLGWVFWARDDWATKARKELNRLHSKKK